MVRTAGMVLAGSVLAFAVGIAAVPSEARARAPRSHVCAADRPAAPAIPPPLALATRPVPGKAVEPREAAAPQSDAETPSQMMGCVSREHPLQNVRLPFAEAAVSLAEAPGSKAGIFRFDSQAARDALIVQWLLEVESDISPDPASLPATPTPTSIFIGGWQSSRWSFPGRRTAHAMFPQNDRSGKLCLVRVDLDGRPEALAALNNWCMDGLDLWAD